MFPWILNSHRIYTVLLFRRLLLFLQQHTVSLKFNALSFCWVTFALSIVLHFFVRRVSNVCIKFLLELNFSVAVPYCIVCYVSLCDKIYMSFYPLLSFCECFYFALAWIMWDMFHSYFLYSMQERHHV